MNLQQLSKHIEEASWFSNLGSFTPAPGQVAIQSLEAWADDDSYYDRHHQKIADPRDHVDRRIGERLDNSELNHPSSPQPPIPAGQDGGAGVRPWAETGAE